MLARLFIAAYRSAGVQAVCLMLGVTCSAALAGDAAALAPVAAGAEAISEKPLAQPGLRALNEQYLAHLRTQPQAVAQSEPGLREALAREYAREDVAAAFIPDALMLLHADFRTAVEAFDRDDYTAVEAKTAPLLAAADPYLAVHALYFHARALAELGKTEELADLLRRLSTAPTNPTDRPSPAAEFATQPAAPPLNPDGLTPYAAHLWFLRGFAAAASLNFDEALVALRRVKDFYPGAPEAVRLGAEQLRIELERREVGTLGEVGELLGYAGERLSVEDAGERVRRRQDEALALLDKLIQSAQQREQQARSRSRSRGRPQQQPRQAAQRSEAPAAAAGEIGELHGVPKADPGEMWGKLPPAEREKILQSLRTRFPSRYRQLVEQYYRSVAEQK